MQKKTAMIVGTGIAGLSIAEMLSRNNYKIILLESQNKIGGEASLATQKWYHTGWLYAALPNPSAMLGCYNALRLYRKMYNNIFSNGQINLSLSEKNVEYLDAKDGWFTDERIYYFYSMSTYELSFLTKLYWPVYFKMVPMRRLKKLYDFEVVTTLDKSLQDLLNCWEKDENGYRKYLPIRTTDAKIQTENVTKALVSSLSNDTEIITNVSFELSEQNNSTKIKLNGVEHSPDLLILASGKSIPTHLRQIGADKTADMIKSVKSPIIILKEKLNLPDFIRFTPNVTHTINHVKFNIEGHGQVSTIGSYYSFPVDDTPAISYYEELLCERIGKTKDDVLGSYYGIKTEFVGKEERRYNHSVMKVNQNTFFALAGKFCQFPLLAYDFAAQMGLSIASSNKDDKLVPDYDLFAPTYPKNIVINGNK